MTTSNLKQPQTTSSNLNKKKVHQLAQSTSIFLSRMLHHENQETCRNRAFCRIRRTSYSRKMSKTHHNRAFCRICRTCCTMNRTVEFKQPVTCTTKKSKSKRGSTTKSSSASSLNKKSKRYRALRVASTSTRRRRFPRLRGRAVHKSGGPL